MFSRVKKKAHSAQMQETFKARGGPSPLPVIDERQAVAMRTLYAELRNSQLQLDRKGDPAEGTGV